MKSKKKRDLPMPMNLLTQYKNKFHGIFEVIENIAKGKGKDLPMWSEKCYIPIAVTLALGDIYSNIDVNHYHMLAALASWRRYKQIYKFDTTLLNELLTSSVDDKIPIQVLTNLPYNSFYVEIKTFDIDGFFVFYDDDCRGNKNSLELRFSVIYSNGSSIPYFIPLINDSTVTDALKIAYRQDLKRVTPMLSKDNKISVLKNLSANNVTDIIDDEHFYKSSSVILALLNLVYYICAKNADITENSDTKKTYKTINTERIKDKFSEIRKWDVGYKVAKMLQNQCSDKSSSSNSSSSNLSSRKRPHTRRAHFHHYWVGKKGEQKLEVRWVHAAFINADKDNDNIIVTINKTS